MAGDVLTAGSDGNTAVGFDALGAGNHDTTHYNTCFGYQAGDVITGGSENTCIGGASDTGAVDAQNQTAIGFFCTAVNVDNSVTLGNAAVTRVYMSQDADAVMYADGTINTSDERFKKDIEDSDLGLSFINSVRPVKYKFKSDKQGSKSRYGIVAQEVIEVLKAIDKEDFAGIETDNPDKLGADYIQFVAPLIKAVQELTAKVEALENA
jgi:NTP pyrophosphatase (non-canonical NTP hydrolase)